MTKTDGKALTQHLESKSVSKKVQNNRKKFQILLEVDKRPVTKIYSEFFMVSPLTKFQVETILNEKTVKNAFLTFSPY